jgi:cell division septation protein DedD
MIEHRYFKSPIRILSLGFCTLFLSACYIDSFSNILNYDQQTGQVSAENLVERDVEAPEVFQVTEAGLWDGRPSLGGVWVAHPDVQTPERVIIRNGTNKKNVIGALFRRERETADPRLQVSSEAAGALALLAGAPVNLTVTALRKRSVSPEPTTTSSGSTATDKPNANAIETAGLKTAKTTPKGSASKKSATLKKPFIQIGIFSIKKNATNAGATMRQLGILPTIKEQKTKDKKFWRVIVGPASSLEERRTLLSSIISAGFRDAYAVTH